MHFQLLRTDVCTAHLSATLQCSACYRPMLFSLPGHFSAHKILYGIWIRKSQTRIENVLICMFRYNRCTSSHSWNIYFIHRCINSYMCAYNDSLVLKVCESKQNIFWMINRPQLALQNTGDLCHDLCLCVKHSLHNCLNFVKWMLQDSNDIKSEPKFNEKILSLQLESNVCGLNHSEWIGNGMMSFA